MRIDADGLRYRELNDRIHAAIRNGDRDFTLDNVRGQRYIGTGLNDGVRITIHGVPGNDLGAFMNGAAVTVHGNGQDGVGNTMNDGKIVIHGDAGDIVGHSMRGGKIFVRGYVGYRAGIHMKAFADHFPIVVVGTRARDYLGEYMAGGVLVVLNLGAAVQASPGETPVGGYVGTGMHGGAIYLRGQLEPHQLGAEVGAGEPDDADWAALSQVIAEYGEDFSLDTNGLDRRDFIKLTPRTSRPYGNLYAY